MRLRRAHDLAKRSDDRQIEHTGSIETGVIWPGKGRALAAHACKAAHDAEPQCELASNEGTMPPASSIAEEE